MPKILMQVLKQVKNGDITLEIVGSIETANAAHLENEFNRATAETKNLTLDFKKVKYVSSSGLRVLLNMQKKCKLKGVNVNVINVNDVVDEVFELTGFNKILHIKK